jgi:PadR family transcriptional regulator PadR
MGKHIISPSLALLQALIEHDSYGLELIERVAERTNGVVKLHQGTIYPELRRLEADGLVTSYEGEPLPERGGRPRRFYALTAEGIRTAREQREAMSALLGLGLGAVR